VVGTCLQVGVPVSSWTVAPQFPTKIFHLDEFPVKYGRRNSPQVDLTYVHIKKSLSCKACTSVALTSQVSRKLHD
jgi:hypothetical protein